MVYENKLAEEFLDALKKNEHVLLNMSFKPFSFEKKGFAYYVQYKKDNCLTEFLFGPSDYQIEMIVYTSKGKFAFKELLQIPEIAAWVNKNQYIEKDRRDLKREIAWFVDLLDFSLPFIE